MLTIQESRDVVVRELDPSEINTVPQYTIGLGFEESQEFETPKFSVRMRTLRRILPVPDNAGLVDLLFRSSIYYS